MKVQNNHQRATLRRRRACRREEQSQKKTGEDNIDGLMFKKSREASVRDRTSPPL